jgi:tetratricopeptide (TPR) repeat protein
VIARAGDHSTARAEFERAIQLDPRNVDPYVNRAYLSLLEGDNRQALAEFDLATAVAPNSAQAWCGMGEVSDALHYAAQTEDSFRRAIQLAPQDPRAYVGLGSHLADNGKGNQARPMLEKAFQLGDRSGRLYGAFAMAFADQPKGNGDLEKAVEYAKQAVATGYSDTSVYYAWGLALQRLGKFQDAIPMFQRDAAASTAANNAWIGISQCYRALGKTDLAESAALKAQHILTSRQRRSMLEHQIRTDPERLDLREQYANLMMENGNYLLAADQYRYVAQHSPDSRERWNRVVNALELGGRKDVAAHVKAAVQKPVAERDRLLTRDLGPGAPSP